MCVSEIVIQILNEPAANASKPDQNIHFGEKMPVSVGTIYTKPWLWKKGNRVSVVGDSNTIKIGGNPEDIKKVKELNRIKSTKYTLITFLPQNLLEQFRRIANFYFLIMTVIAIIIDSPVSPLTSLIPLVFVIAVTATKQGYENYLRYRADNMVNFSLVTVIRNGEEHDIRCQDIMPGDLVKVPRDCDVPCDLVLLKSSEENGKCHITTANLDGESNLKTLSIPKGLPNVEREKMHTLGIIECESPKTDLYSFSGKIELAPIYTRLTSETECTLPLMAENLMLRGARVKNTEWAIGCAVYTGQNTKLALNSKITRSKMTSSEKYINKFLVFFLVMLIAIVTVSYFLKRYNDQFRFEHNVYLGEPTDTYQVSQFLQDYFSFLILFNYLIPISLYVTIEMHKFIGSFFMEWDLDLYDADMNQPCIVNTSDLNEELGQVRILFSDKTGTLTKNEMIFQQCSIDGNKYLHKGMGIQNLETHKIYKFFQFNAKMYEFFEALALCHTVQIAGNKDLLNSERPSLNNSSIFDMRKIKEEDGQSGSIDSDADDDLIEMRPRISNESNASRPISLLEYERMSMKNNITRRMFMGDLNPLLTRKLNGPVDIKLNFVGKNHLSNGGIPSTNINELPEIPSVKSTDKVTKRPISEILNSPQFDRFGGGGVNERPVSVIENPLLDRSLDEVDYQKNTNINPFLASTLPRNLTRTISANDTASLTKLTHRRTQSHGAAVTHSVKPAINPHPLLYRTLSRQSTIRSEAREYYAAPSYNEASLLERKESMMKRGILKTVIEQLDYQASSPDEKALVEACGKLGIIFTGDDDEILNLDIKQGFTRQLRPKVDTVDAALSVFKSDENSVKFTRLAVLEFSSDRKRMSVIVRDRNDQIWLYTKGAESYVFPLCHNTDAETLLLTQTHVNDFAKQGLRTLAVAKRKMSEDEYTQFHKDLIIANNSLADRKTLVAEVQSRLEMNLELLGATAVEDALQDNVRDTLESLRIAGIRVWVLTGDKVETALNIALSCGHIPENAFKYFITECKTLEQVQQHLTIFNREMMNNPDGAFTLLIDGSSLAIAIEKCSIVFRDIAIKCRAVLCCRLSPLQKCEVVQLMKTVDEKPITAAIGDGANDVSMIQEAHVGLGIVGKEGRQAARCADYAFANFSMVKKVLLVHGHYYSQRLALLVLYFFYKNLVFMSIQFYFQANSMFSSQSIYDSLFLTLYNVIYSALPILFISLTEKIQSEHVLITQPELYKTISRNKALHWKYFIGWMVLATYHGSVIYIFSFVIWNSNPVILTSPHTVNLACLGTFLMHNVTVIVNLKLWLEAKYQSFMFIATLWISILGFMLTTFIYNLFNLFDGSMLAVYNNLLSSLTFWLLSLIIIIASLVPDYVMKTCKSLNITLSSLFPGIDKTFKRRKFISSQNQSTYL